MGQDAGIFVMVLFSIFALSAFLGVRLENLGIPRRAWERWERAVDISAKAVFCAWLYVGVCGCGASLPQPTDPVTVEVVACEPTLGGTPGQYLQLKIQRTEVGVCEAAMSDGEDVRRAARAAAERDVDRLGQEFDVYQVQGRTDCYCGPVCQEMTKYLLEARTNGLFCGP